MVDINNMVECSLSLVLAALILLLIYKEQEK